jgi:hypothetical protein
MLAGVSVSLCICCLVLLLFTYWDWHNASQQSVLYHLGYQRVPTGKFLVLITFAGLFAIAPSAPWFRCTASARKSRRRDASGLAQGQTDFPGGALSDKASSLLNWKVWEEQARNGTVFGLGDAD